MRIMITLATLALSTTAQADDKKKMPAEPKVAPPKWEAPKPAREVADMGKGMAGNWRCTGKSVVDDKGTWVTFKGTNKTTVDGALDKFWIRGEWVTEAANKAKMKGVEYLTYDGAEKKWYRVAMDNTGGHEVATSADGKAWTGEMRMGGMTIKTKATVALEGRQLKVIAEAEMARKWHPVFEMTCKK